MRHFIANRVITKFSQIVVKSNEQLAIVTAQMLCVGPTVILLANWPSFGTTI